MLMKINPDIPEARHLQIWYSAGGGLTTTQLATPTRPADEGDSFCSRPLSCTSNSSGVETNRTDRTRTARPARSRRLCHRQSNAHAHLERPCGLHGLSQRLLLSTQATICVRFRAARTMTALVKSLDSRRECTVVTNANGSLANAIGRTCCA